jgi:non-ribosomal peptide synthetase component F
VRPWRRIARGEDRPPLDALDHQALTFGALLRQLNLKRDPSRNALVSVMFNHGRAQGSPRFGEVTPQLRSTCRPAASELRARDEHRGRGFGLLVECSYNEDLFAGDTIRRWLGHYATLLAGDDLPSEAPLDRLSLLTDDERQSLLDLNGTEGDYPRNALTQGSFEAQAARTPERIAIRCGAESVSYAALDARANRLAQALRSRGIGRGQRVGLCIERGADMLAAVLGTQAGAAYVPLDPAFPAEHCAWRRTPSSRYWSQLRRSQICLACPATANCCSTPMRLPRFAAGPTSGS